MAYSIDELKMKITPIAVKYNLPSVFIFGTENDENGIDILIKDDAKSGVESYKFSSLYNDLCNSLNKEVSLTTVKAPDKGKAGASFTPFVNNAPYGGVMIYERSNN